MFTFVTCPHTGMWEEHEVWCNLCSCTFSCNSPCHIALFICKFVKGVNPVIIRQCLVIISQTITYSNHRQTENKYENFPPVMWYKIKSCSWHLRKLNFTESCCIHYFEVCCVIGFIYCCHNEFLIDKNCISVISSVFN